MKNIILSIYDYYNVKNLINISYVVCKFYLSDPFTPKILFHCSWAVNWTAEYGTILTIVALFPRHKLSKPSVLRVFIKNLIAAFAENGWFEIWKFIFVRSKGAIVVFANAPAIAPDNKLVHTLCALDIPLLPIFFSCFFWNTQFNVVYDIVEY